MTNSSLRKRFAIEEQNAAKASRIMAETVKVGLIKPFDPLTSDRYLSYVPFWA
jgi:ATP-dependent DNA helicase RecG